MRPLLGSVFPTASLVGILALVTSGVSAKTDGPRRDKSTIDSVVIHATGGPICKDGKVVFTPASTASKMKRFFDDRSTTVGTHYIIDRDGKTLTSTPEDRVANHAQGHNPTSIGIELINSGDGKDPYGDKQIAALISLLKRLVNDYRIKESKVLLHSEIDKRTFNCGGKSVKQKQDPGANFPKATVLKAVFRR